MHTKLKPSTHVHRGAAGLRHPAVPAASNWLDQETLRRNLARLLPAKGWDCSMIANVCSARSSLSTSYDTGLVAVHFRDGSTLTLFLKNYDHSSRRRHESERRREREINVYKHLLSQNTLGTAEYYGNVSDDERGLHWLLLEYVEGTPVRHFSIERWIEAAAWLGRIHGSFYHRSEVLRSCKWLVDHNAGFYLENADNALRAVAEIAPHLMSALEPIVERHAMLVQDMVRSPSTLVHGDYHSRNVMACPGTAPVRMCVFDWETAGFGSPYYDLAHLVDGFDPPVLDRFLQRYAEAVQPFGMPVPDHAYMRYLVNCFRLHMIIKYLSHGIFKGYTEAILEKLIISARTRYDEARRSADEDA